MSYGMQFDYKRFIKDVSPRNGESGVSLDKIIVIKFLDDIDVDTITPENIILLSLVSRKEIPITYEYDFESRSLRIAPKIALTPNAQHKLIIRGNVDGIRTIIGDCLPVSFDAEFTTGEAEEMKAPEIIYPLHRTIVDMPLEIKVKRKDKSEYAKVEVSDTSDFHKPLYSLATPMIFAFDTDELLIKPDLTLPEGRYFIRAQVMNEAGELSGYSDAIHIVTDGNMPETIPPEIEVPAPDDESGEIDIEDLNNNLEGDDEDEEEEGAEKEAAIIGMHPKQDALHIPIELLSVISIHFDGEIDPESITSDTVYLVKERI